MTTTTPSTTQQPKPPSLGGIPIKSLADEDRTLTMIIWGKSSAGKTVLAATMPGKKLWLNFDPRGTQSIPVTRSDVVVADFSGQDPSVVEKFKADDPMDMSRIIKEQEINSIIFDSTTTFSEMSLTHGVDKAQSYKQYADATIEVPGYGGYGHRKAWMMLCIINLLRVAIRTKTHICFVTHEDSPERDAKGNLLYITMMLGSDLAEKAGLHISEIWHLEDTGSERRIAVRNCRGWKPIRSRMFEAEGSRLEFTWKYDAQKNEGMTIAKFYEQWKANNFRKIPIPA